jgi:carbamoyltransferase
LRPQLVSEQSNTWMYTMLKEYEKMTWMWWVMNTSLNIHWYPLVWTLEQALFTFENSWLQYLLVDQFLISKKA